MRLVSAFVALLAALMVCGSAAAQSTEASGQDRATAQTLFREGRKLLVDGQFAEALPKFAESYRLDPGIGTLFNLARCHHELGQFASAIGHYRRVLTETQRRDQAERAADVQARISEIEPRLSFLRVLVAAPVDGLVVKRGETTIGAAQWGVHLPIDPGTHWIAASAPGFLAWRTKLTVQGEKQHVVVEVPALQPEPVVAPPPPSPALTPATLPPARTTQPADRPPSLQPVVGGVIAGIGGVTLLVGTGIGIAAKVKHDGATANCGDNGDPCSQDNANIVADAQELGNVGTGVFVAGAVLAAVGVTVWLTSPNDDAELTLGLLGTTFVKRF